MSLCQIHPAFALLLQFRDERVFSGVWEGSEIGVSIDHAFMAGPWVREKLTGIVSNGCSWHIGGANKPK